MTKQKVLVLGGGGYIGRHLIQKLQKDSDIVIYAIGRNCSSINSRSVDSDITFSSLKASFEYERFDWVINCSGSGSVSVAEEFPLDDFYNTVAVVADVLEFIRCFSPNAKYSHLSSAAVYGNVDSLPIPLNATPSPISMYGRSNYLAEQLVENFSNHYDLSSVVIRFFSVYGPGLRKQLLWDACNKLSKGEHEFFGTGKELRDWVYIEDAIDLIIDSANQVIPGNVLYIQGGTGVAHSVSEVLELVSLELNGNSRVSFKNVTKVGDPLGMQADTEIRFKSITKLEVGIKNYVEWYKGAVLK